MKFVPHNGDSYPPVVGSAQQPFDCTESDTNAEQDLASLNKEDEDMGADDQDSPNEENENVNTSSE